MRVDVTFVKFSIIYGIITAHLQSLRLTIFGNCHEHNLISMDVQFPPLCLYLYSYQ